ncbi:hypothetical protein HK100_001287 [Physocladia obscura]|uniref:Pentatricopeptide repeat-containing protein n=1 Tax=Physocladia obscura TaxID=109957 RepID=A0AAD5T9A3_9FUNG|nr:hypothetical protein HK100_001287 [Physocladia obscura]
MIFVCGGWTGRVRVLRMGVWGVVGKGMGVQSGSLAWRYARLVGASARAGTAHSLRRAESLLETMERGVRPSHRRHLGLYAQVLHGYARLRDTAGVARLLRRLRFVGLEPDAVLNTIVLQALVAAGLPDAALRWHAHVVRPPQAAAAPNTDTRYYNALIAFFAKSSHLDRMLQAFEEMCARHPPDEHSYTTIIHAYMCANEPQLAVFWFDLMQGKRQYLSPFSSSVSLPVYPPIQPTVASFTALISGFAKRKDLPEALRWFQLLCAAIPTTIANSTLGTTSDTSDLFAPNLKTYTAVLHAYAKTGDMKGAEKWIERMASDLAVDKTIPNSNLNSNSSSKKSHSHSNTMSLFDGHVYNTLIGGYAGKQDYLGATKILKEMRDCNIPGDAITFGMLIGSHLKKTAEYPDGNVEAAILTFKEMISQDPPVFPTLHIFTLLIARIGHIVGKLDSLGRPTAARGGGGYLAISRRLQPKPTKPTQVFPALLQSPPSPPATDSQSVAEIIPRRTSEPAISSRPKEIHKENLLYLYNLFRKSLSKLLVPIPPPPPTLLKNHEQQSPIVPFQAFSNPAATHPPLPIYDAVLAHHSTLHQIPAIKQTVYHALVDGAVPDESFIVRAVKGIGRAAGFDGIWHFVRDIGIILTDLNNIRSVAVIKEKRRQNENKDGGDGGDGGGYEAVKSKQQNNSRNSFFGGRLVSNLLKEVENIDSSMNRWMEAEEQSEFIKMVNAVGIAAYPVYAFQSRRLGISNNYEDNKTGKSAIQRADLMKYDPKTRQHQIGVNIFNDEGADSLWKLVVRLQAQHGSGFNSTNFFQFRYLFLRHCEVNGFWRTRNEFVEWLHMNGELYDDFAYRKWLSGRA